MEGRARAARGLLDSRASGISAHQQCTRPLLLPSSVLTYMDRIRCTGPTSKWQPASHTRDDHVAVHMHVSC